MRGAPNPVNHAVRKTLIGAACLSLQPLALNALGVPVTAYIIHRLGPDAFGHWMAAASILGFCAVLTNLGLRAAFVRAVAANPSGVGDLLAEQLGLRLLLALLAGLLGVLACRSLGYPTPALWCTAVGAAGLALTTVATTLADVLQATQRVTTLAAVNLGSGLALTAVSFAAAWAGADSVGIAAAYLTGPALSAMLLVMIVSRRVCGVRVRSGLRTGRHLLMGSRFFAAQQLLFVGSAQAEALLSPRLIGMNQFGFFTAGSMLANRLGVLPDALCTAAYPAMVKACEHGAPRGAGAVLRYLLVAVAGGVLVGLAGTLAAEPIGRMLLPGQPALFAFVVRVTIWSVPLAGVELVQGYALYAAGKDAVQARLAVPASLFSLVLAAALVSRFGLAGACWSMLLRPAVRAAFLAPVAVRTFRAASDAPSGREDVAPASAGPLLRKAG